MDLPPPDQDKGQGKREADSQWETSPSKQKRPKVQASDDNIKPEALPEISFSEITDLQEIASGSFGLVYKGRCRGAQVAVKELYTKITDEQTGEVTLAHGLSEASIEAFKREVKIMSSFSHPNICLFMGICVQPDRLFIVSEYLPKGTVEGLLLSNEQLSLHQRVIMAKEAAMALLPSLIYVGVAWLHGSNFVHRDLKTSNLLLDSQYKVKVCDFGLSQMKKPGQMLRDGKKGAKGTPIYMAPEVLEGECFNEKADVYAFGIILWEFTTREEPFKEFTKYKSFRNAVLQNTRPPIKEGTPIDLVNLIHRCWDGSQTNRPGFQEIVKYLKTIDMGICISDAKATDFWEKSSNEDYPYEIPWGEFWEKLCTTLHYPAEHKQTSETQVSQTERCLLLLLECEKSQTNENQSMNVVTIQNFGNFLRRFGPFDSDILYRAYELCKQTWFHGNISQQDVQHLLSQANPGAFLVRLSTSFPEAFTISKVSTAIDHYRVPFSPQKGFLLEKSTTEKDKGKTYYPTLQELVRSENLSSPVGRSKFAVIFEESNKAACYKEKY